MYVCEEILSITYVYIYIYVIIIIIIIIIIIPIMIMIIMIMILRPPRAASRWPRWRGVAAGPGPATASSARLGEGQMGSALMGSLRI